MKSGDKVKWFHAVEWMSKGGIARNEADGLPHKIDKEGRLLWRDYEGAWDETELTSADQGDWTLLDAPGTWIEFQRAMAELKEGQRAEMSGAEGNVYLVRSGGLSGPWFYFADEEGDTRERFQPHWLDAKWRLL